MLTVRVERKQLLIGMRELFLVLVVAYDATSDRALRLRVQQESPRGKVHEGW